MAYRHLNKWHNYSLNKKHADAFYMFLLFAVHYLLKNKGNHICCGYTIARLYHLKVVYNIAKGGA
jgi:hypothetical protein